MTESTTLDTVGRLRASLDAVATALAAVDLDRLQAAEGELAAAVDAVTRLVVRGGADARLAAEVMAARAALERCRVLGGSFTQFADCTLVAVGRAATYERPGGPRAAGAAPLRRLRASL
jgi:hypothetical protein